MSKTSPIIYLDHAAATPLSPVAKQAMEPFWAQDFFNPSSPYLPAKRVREAYEDAKNRLAHLIGAKGNDLVITAGATESINLAFTAASNCLILATEHDSVRAVASRIEHQEIAVNQYGLIDLEDFRAKLTPEVDFISIAMVNNELGAIQPFSQISEIIRQERQRRLGAGEPNPLFFHSDASQAFNLIDLNVSRLGVDLLTLNSAKVYGPKAVGALFIKSNVKLSPIQFGGGQERGLRAGTENVPGLIGFAAAAAEAKAHLKSNRQHYVELVDILKNQLQTAQIEPVFLGHPKHQLANFCPVSFPGLDAERLIFMLEEQGVCLSTGAACSASKGQKSHVLAAIGLSDTEIAGSLRITLGLTNDQVQIERAGALIAAAVNQERQRLSEPATKVQAPKAQADKQQSIKNQDPKTHGVNIQSTKKVAAA